MGRALKSAKQFPWIVNLELTNACNLECVFCDHRILKKRMRIQNMGASLVRKILIDIKGALGRRKMHELGLVGLGEPTLDRNLASHLELVNQYADCFARISLNSNLVSLTREKAQYLARSSINTYTFSINTSNRKSYFKMMGRDHFDKVIRHLTFFLDILNKKNKKATIGIQLFKSAASSLEELRKSLPSQYLKQIHFFYRKLYFKPALQIKHFSFSLPKVKIGPRYPCWDIYSRVYIDVQGNLYPCTIGNDCYRENSEYCLGNIRDDSLLGLFNGSHIRLARLRSEYGNLPFKRCDTCNIWSLTPNNFFWDSDKQKWEKKEKQVRSFGIKG